LILKKRKILVSLAITVIFIFTGLTNAFAWTYSVKKWDSLYSISKSFGNNDTQVLKKVNGLASNNIYPGQHLWIPEENYQVYWVQPGDSLYLVSQRFGVSVKQIKSLNKLYTNTIRPGKTLLLPKYPVRPAASTFSRSSSNREDVMMLARLIYGEARGESYVGKVAIAAVSLNRVASPKFPNTLRGVIFQPWAFTAIEDGQYWLQPDSESIKAATDALNGWDPTYGALYYWNPAIATSTWVWSRTITGQIGRHLFAI